MLTVIADITVHAGAAHKQNVLNAFAKMIPTVLQEPGCHGYQLLLDHDGGVDYQSRDSNVIIMLEHWQDMAALNTHLQTPHMQAYQAAVADDVEHMKVRILEAGLPQR
ncbi:antibiotic biosynthesis monooxygenase [Vitreoscilla massiliensis]|uniref:Antibiotic biosynthesis monooxygenase n=1 Tax=Vitreoscilla massiliensis TaxID=1689272 RepID=A0ABY4E742_9NEIS|nr:putative quinol monooxygenase [Vitreoscilla massiliensis]UOO90705.1 antibiotic biosynthesis monooxygenase [Vitreoscilla massiliensis]